jgi:cephalosporin-C deacetylase-like acetyl esterase
MLQSQNVTIHGVGPELAAHLYLPPRASEPVPAVVTASGFGGVKEMLLPVFGRALAQAGIATLAVDYAGCSSCSVSTCRRSSVSRSNGSWSTWPPATRHWTHIRCQTPRS